MALRVVVLESHGVDAREPSVTGPSVGAAATTSHFQVPDYLPALVRSLLPWTRRRWETGIVAGMLGDCTRVGRD
jgi:hypothetical protein